ncbi:type II toxin-antitoxin system RelE/ParE family toxin [Desulfomicrobium apsheronum]|uniref:type II toxin-antitoxin system RelE/ParE family toxin n=1 Tax=Desulfomicrobium apsheronum TaxID=52560 RepID=UPI003CCBF2E1
MRNTPRVLDFFVSLHLTIFERPANYDFFNNQQDVHFPGAGLHPLQGNLTGHWSVRVSGNWRVTF